GCFLSWNAQRNLFEERRAKEGAGKDAGELCRDVTWSADGSEGSDGSKLTAFPWKVDKDHRLIVDLRPAQSRATSTSITQSGGGVVRSGG
ncbi:MAG: hypothetical protein JST64_13595, partial [Actinobacteria bacterium]|nr:hypothetical protein [Actinomycetota bacterium]